MSADSGLSGKKILIVDDDPNVIKGLLESLKNEQCIIDTATDGLEGFEKIASDEYDLIISDVMMPGLNGQKLYKYMSEVKPHLIHRCILITGAMNDELEAFCKSVNLPFLNKPFSTSDLKKMISVLLVKSEKRAPSL
ncbi:MAG: response regulator [Nitrospirae bacterium]|nr:response regulator [Nitrospirota bacterium]MBI3595059.1 response regulator [Nitrospirota bacterium]